MDKRRNTFNFPIHKNVSSDQGLSRVDEKLHPNKKNLIRRRCKSCQDLTEQDLKEWGLGQEGAEGSATPTVGPMAAEASNPGLDRVEAAEEVIAMYTGPPGFPGG